MACTKNDVTLGSEGVGRATGYQNTHKSDVGDARTTHNDVWALWMPLPDSPRFQAVPVLEY